MTLAQLKTKANAKLVDFWTVLQAKEDAYFAKHGTYFGFNPSPATKVDDGVDTDLVIEHPQNRTGHHLEDLDFPATQLPFQIWVMRMNQQIPINTATFNLGEAEPTPIYAQTGEYYHAFVRVELPNGDVYLRNRTKDGVDSNWYQEIITPPV